MLWNEFQEKLIKKFGDKKGEKLFLKYKNVFSPSYITDCNVDTALNDIDYIENLNADNVLTVKLYKYEGSKHHFNVRILQYGNALLISDFMHVLENLGLLANTIQTYTLSLSNKINIYIYNITVISEFNYEFDSIEFIFKDAFLNICLGKAENVRLNRLVLNALLTWREIMILRVYAKYLQYIDINFELGVIENVLNTHVSITQNLIEYFKLKHDPTQNDNSKKFLENLENKIHTRLKSLTIAQDIKILRKLFLLLKHCIRTNYFQLDKNGMPKKDISVKFHFHHKQPTHHLTPLYEMFVYSATFEGIYLRESKVSMGGVVVTDKTINLRHKILNDLKLESMRNSSITPSAAKGGLMVKMNNDLISKVSFEHIDIDHCYRRFLQGLMDITDNIINHTIVYPKNVICFDDADPYLVVDGKRETAGIGDLVADEYDYWLTDGLSSFSNPMNTDKKSLIIADGVWEVIKRHCLEAKITLHNISLTMVAIGDTQDRSFANILTSNNKIKLVAAFDKDYIFVDPNPDPDISYRERKRLFNIPGLTWADYNVNSISTGGGIFKRSEKLFSLSPEIIKLFGIKNKNINQEDLIHCILKLSVDVLFIADGLTYVKSTAETHLETDLHHKISLINGKELRSKIIVEGAINGITHSGRIEYAMNGGLINADFIDTSTELDYVDYELNLRILLNSITNETRDNKKADQIIRSALRFYSELVIHNTYNLLLSLSYASFYSKRDIGLYENYIKHLEKMHIINRKQDYIPVESIIFERSTSIGLTHAELAVLMAYSKILIKSELRNSDIFADEYFNHLLADLFPEALKQKYKEEIANHYFRNYIIANFLANKIINEVGITFVHDLQLETGAKIEDIVKGLIVSSAIFEVNEIRSIIKSFDFKLSLSEQYEILNYLNNLLTISCRWFLRGNHLNNNIADVIKKFSVQIKLLEGVVPELMGGVTKEYFHSLTEQFISKGFSKKIASRIATFRAIYTTLNIIEVANTYNYDLLKTAKIYFLAGERVNLLWFRDYIGADVRQDFWSRMARLTLRDELDIAQRNLAISIIETNKIEVDTVKMIENWVDNNNYEIERWNKFLSTLLREDNIDYFMLFIVLRIFMGILV